MSRNFSGPLPPPELLRQYQEVIPGLAETIVNLMVDEGKHRHEMESRQLTMAEKWSDGDLTLQKRGQIFGFALGFFGIVGGLVVAAIGQPTGGVIVSGASLTAIVIAFLKRRTASSDGGDTEDEEDKE